MWWQRDGAVPCGAGIMKWYWPAIFVILTLGALSPAVVGAQEPAVQVTSNYPYPLRIDGVDVTIFPAEVPAGAQVCATSEPDYINENERIVFQRWSHGPTDLCTTFNEPGEFTAMYGPEILLTIDSQAKEFRETRWVTKGAPALLSVPEEVVERPGVRYLFEDWSTGENRFSPENRIVPIRPLTLEVRWTKEYLLKLVGPEGVSLVGEGWITAGTTRTIQAEASTSETGADIRFEFREWEVISNPAIVIPNVGSFQTTIRMDNTHEIRANYHDTFHVVVTNPDKELNNVWVPLGGSVPVDTPSIIDRDEEKERLSFQGWEGADIDTAKATITVTGPMRVKAIYERQFKVTVETKFAVISGDGWYTEGEVATISVPETVSTVFFLNRSFSGFDGFSTEDPVLELQVNEAVTVTAAYETSVDVLLLGLIIGAVVAVGLIYLVTQREYNRRRRVIRW